MAPRGSSKNIGTFERVYYFCIDVNKLVVVPLVDIYTETYFKHGKTEILASQIRTF